MTDSGRRQMRARYQSPFLHNLSKYLGSGYCGRVVIAVELDAGFWEGDLNVTEVDYISPCQ
jgi:hypothetical protein